MQIKGKVLEVMPVQQVNDKFRKREFVVEYAENSQYVETIKFECIQNNCDLLDAVKSGDQVEVHFNLRGRAYTNPQGQKNYFNSLQAWKINKGSEPSSDRGSSFQPDPEPTFSPDPTSDDDLPF